MLNWIQIYKFGWIQTSQTGGQPYRDTRVSECSLPWSNEWKIFVKNLRHFQKSLNFRRASSTASSCWQASTTTIPSFWWAWACRRSWPPSSPTQERSSPSRRPARITECGRWSPRQVSHRFMHRYTKVYFLQLIYRIWLKSWSKTYSRCHKQVFIIRLVFNLSNNLKTTSTHPS